MSNDLTQKLPGDQEPISHQADDKLSELVSAVQSLSTNVQYQRLLDRRVENLESKTP